jgi:uncharacterized protein
MICEYCYMNGRKAEYMSKHTMKQAIDFGFKTANVLQVQITGGEPFLYFPGIRILLDLLKEKRRPFVVQVQTNGTVISDDIMDFIKQENIAVGVSFEGFAPPSEQPRKMAASTAFPIRSVLRSLRAFAEYGIKIGITCVVTSKNVNFLNQLIDFVFPLGSVYSLHFTVVRKIGMAKDKSCLLPDLRLYEYQLKHLIEKWKEYNRWCKRMGPRVEIRFIENFERNIVKPASFRKCNFITRTGCYVEPNGTLYPCASLSGEPDFLLGTIKDGIDEKRYACIEAKFLKVLKTCRRCDELSLCGGACLARVYYNDRFPFYECIEYKAAKETIKKKDYPFRSPRRRFYEPEAIFKGLEEKLSEASDR